MTTTPVGGLVEEAIRAMLREVVREVVRDEVRAALAALIVAPTAREETPAGALLTVREVALELKVTEPTVREWIKSGELSARRLGGRGQKRLLRVTRESLDAFKRRRAAGDDADAGSVDEQARDILNIVRAKGAGR